MNRSKTSHMKQNYIAFIPTERNDYETATNILRRQGIKKHDKVNYLILGASILLFLSNTENAFSNNEEALPRINCTYISNSVCLSEEQRWFSEPSPNMTEHRIAKAKIKKKYVISDEEMEKRVAANPTPTSTQTEEGNIDEFIRYNSGHYIDCLEEWL